MPAGSCRPVTSRSLSRGVTVTDDGGAIWERKLLDTQEKGKKRMRPFGKVEIPQEASSPR